MNIKPVVNNIDSKEDIIVRKLDIVKAGWSEKCDVKELEEISKQLSEIYIEEKLNRPEKVQ